jgi:hypothetical protein
MYDRSWCGDASKAVGGAAKKIQATVLTRTIPWSSMVSEIHERSGRMGIENPEKPTKVSISVHRAGRSQIRVSIDQAGLKFVGAVACLSPGSVASCQPSPHLLSLHADCRQLSKVSGHETFGRQRSASPIRSRTIRPPNDARHDSSGGVRVAAVGCVVVRRWILDVRAEDMAAHHAVKVMRPDFLREEKLPSLLRREPTPICLVAVAAILPQNPQAF